MVAHGRSGEGPRGDRGRAVTAGHPQYTGVINSKPATHRPRAAWELAHEWRRPQHRPQRILRRVPVDYQTQQCRRKELPTYQGANDSILLTMPPDHASGACRHALRTICGDGVIGFEIGRAHV